MLREHQEKEGKEKLMNNCLAEVNVRDIRASKQSKVVLAASESLISYPLITRERRRVTGHTPAVISVYL